MAPWERRFSLDEVLASINDKAQRPCKHESMHQKVTFAILAKQRECSMLQEQRRSSAARARDFAAQGDRCLQHSTVGATKDVVECNDSLRRIGCEADLSCVVRIENESLCGYGDPSIDTASDPAEQICDEILPGQVNA
eukprot:gnl/TRDRNA2_/TRDRNA2_32892_c0_seq1.p1 gnl/TRDRNA2_/TRDRNA2_32892_c0~~gnl/TRDRNA2_/TRDRNA2_32892_c0_seq1.p1  ORF type:complete len:138 (-),score=20.90 gnl/TRDRNA2_/TRDRNA2_32892_c0_seq1:106-519(-)